MSCGHFHPLNRLVCRRCMSKRLEADKLPITGRLVHHTMVSQPHLGYENTVPYIVGWVEMDDGTHLIGQITDCDPQDLRPGIKMEVVVRRLRADGDSKLIVYGAKFRPII